MFALLFHNNCRLVWGYPNQPPPQQLSFGLAVALAVPSRCSETNISKTMSSPIVLECWCAISRCVHCLKRDVYIASRAMCSTETQKLSHGVSQLWVVSMEQNFATGCWLSFVCTTVHVTHKNHQECYNFRWRNFFPQHVSEWVVSWLNKTSPPVFESHLCAPQRMSFTKITRNGTNFPVAKFFSIECFTTNHQECELFIFWLIPVPVLLWS